MPRRASSHQSTNACRRQLARHNECVAAMLTSRPISIGSSSAPMCTRCRLPSKRTSKPCVRRIPKRRSEMSTIGTSTQQAASNCNWLDRSARSLRKFANISLTKFFWRRRLSNQASHGSSEISLADSSSVISLATSARRRGSSTSNSRNSGSIVAAT